MRSQRFHPHFPGKLCAPAFRCCLLVAVIIVPTPVLIAGELAPSAKDSDNLSFDNEYELLKKQRAAAGWDELEDAAGVMSFIEELSDHNKLGFVSVDWGGCLACGADSAYITALNKLPRRYRKHNFSFAYIQWRDPGVYPPDFKAAITPQYKLFLHLTAAKSQLYGGGRKVETFTDIDENWRPKFPQLFALDGSRISASRIRALQKLHSADLLFHPSLGKVPGGGKTCYSGDLRLGDFAVRHAVQNALADDSVLLQFTNFHLYRASGDRNSDFVKTAFFNSCDCVVDQFLKQPEIPEMCHRFERPRD